MRIMIAQLNPTVGALRKNADKIIASLAQAEKEKVELVLFPELTLCGYPPEDLLHVPKFVQQMEEELLRIATTAPNLTAIVGLARYEQIGKRKFLRNSAAILSNGQILGYYNKNLLPTYDVFDERRYFEPGSEPLILKIADKKVAITICEDTWQHSGLLRSVWYQQDPVAVLKAEKLDLLLNLSASPYSMYKLAARHHVYCLTAQALNCPVAYCNQVGANDSLLFDGNSCFINSQGQLVASAKSFEEDSLLIDTEALPPSAIVKKELIDELHKALVIGVRDYCQKLGIQKVCLGLSGGIDSAVVACIAQQAVGKQNVLAITMPSRYSSEESSKDAALLAERLGIRFLEIPIEAPFNSYLQLLNSNFAEKTAGVVEENLQARIRGMLLMAFSNQFDYLLLNTGNKSELAMGYCTLYGDMCGGISVLGDLFKTVVYELALLINRQQEIIPLHTITRPPSAELRPNQKDSDTLPDYGIIDTIFHSYLELEQSPQEIAEKQNYPIELVLELVKKFYRNEFKRRQAPPVLRVTEKALTPPAGRRVPIVQGWV